MLNSCNAKRYSSRTYGKEYMRRDSIRVTLWVSTGLKIQEAQCVIFYSSGVLN
jgi:hypothetical protein